MEEIKREIEKRQEALKATQERKAEINEMMKQAYEEKDIEGWVQLDFERMNEKDIEHSIKVELDALEKALEILENQR